MCEGDSSENLKVSEEGGGGGAPGARADIHLQHMVTLWETCSGAGSWQDHGGLTVKLILEQVCWLDL